jgi:hypothetical protein
LEYGASTKGGEEWRTCKGGEADEASGEVEEIGGKGGRAMNTLQIRVEITKRIQFNNSIMLGFNDLSTEARSWVRAMVDENKAIIAELLILETELTITEK